MDILSAYREVGSYRGAADICGTTHKTVKRAVLADAAKNASAESEMVVHNYDDVRNVVAERVAKTQGRISAKRLLPVARAAGYAGSARNFRRLVAQEKQSWRRSNHRGRRPAVWSPGDMLVIDWGEIGSLSVFCAVLAWSRWRFVFFADNQRADTTMAALAACFEALGGVPATVLSDRMGCLKAATVAGLVVPTADYVRFATHYGFRPDFCEGHDPESKGLVENLVGYVKSDLMIPAELTAGDLVAANAAGVVWRAEVNAAVHSEISAVPDERLAVERDLLRVILLGTVQATHTLVAPGETSIVDDHYGGPRPATPARAVRPKTAAEIAFCALGPAAVAFIKAAAAAGNSKLGGDLDELAAMEAAHGRDALIAAVERAVEFGRHRASDVRSILAAGTGVARPTQPGDALIVALPAVATRPLSDYAIGEAT